MKYKHIAWCTDISGDTAVLAESESFHCIRVLRLKKLDIIGLSDGRGILYEAVIMDADPKKCRVRITGAENLPINGKAQLHLGISPLKQTARFEWFIEKAVELGVSKITPLLCERTEKHSVSTDRIKNLMIAAAKQSGNLLLPEFSPAVSFERFIQNPNDGAKYIASCSEGEKTMLTELNPELSTCILIGPEGDFSQREITMARQNGFRLLTLGHHRLRSETAAITIAAYFSIINHA